MPTGDFRVLNLDEVYILQDSFDAIFIKAVLLHVPKEAAEERFKKIVALLKPGGYVYIAVKEKRSDGVEEEVKVENDYGYSSERFFSYFTQEEIRKYMYNANCEVVFFEVTPNKKTNWIQAIGIKRK